jgi:hypothetical protein
MIKSIKQEDGAPKKYPAMLTLFNDYLIVNGKHNFMDAKNEFIHDLNQILVSFGDKYGVMDRSKVADITGVILEEVTEHIKSLNDPYFK